MYRFDPTGPGRDASRITDQTRSGYKQVDRYVIGRCRLAIRNLLDPIAPRGPEDIDRQWWCGATALIENAEIDFSPFLWHLLIIPRLRRRDQRTKGLIVACEVGRIARIT